MNISFIHEPVPTWLSRFRFSRPFEVRFSDIDVYGHVNNVIYFRYFEQARIDYFQHLGLFDLFFDESSTSMIVTADLYCQYVSPVTMREKIATYVRTVEIGISSIELHYAVLTDAPEKRLVAVGRGRLVHVDRKTGKSAPLPESIREALRNFEGLEPS
ncbi:MAG: Thioesterase superfamily [Candidatus Carbobacillus altaicus]|uniref:Thioesterase superfamily n=1 Tax=Candidatus Carbonibacillus altaicus TaxID=2163959 RepID=A0A2R6Y5C8_9BACL|nr:MAG: Thioesterase superfamily [Candidatus Carbobacillus altaicus]